MKRTALTALALLSAAVACHLPGRPPPPASQWLVVDVDARPRGRSEGAVFALRDARRIELFAADDAFVDPQQILAADPETYFLVDLLGDPQARGRRGAIHRLDPSGRVVGVVRSDLLAMPVSALVWRDLLLVADRAALPKDERRGCVFVTDARGEAPLRPAVLDPRFRAPAFLFAAEGRPILLDADARSPHGGEGVFFALDPKTGRAERLGALTGAVSPLGVVVEPEGTWLVFDANADPERRGRPHGAVFRYDPRTDRTEVVTSDPILRDPVRGMLLPDGEVWFADANADPFGRGPDPVGRGQNRTGPGAVFALDRRTGALRVVASAEAFVNPVQVWAPPRSVR